MIYLDNAATTKLDEKCLEIIKEYSLQGFYNPSALYRKAAENSNAIKKAKTIIAKSIGAKREEIIFTASGSEYQIFRRLIRSIPTPFPAEQPSRH